MELRPALELGFCDYRVTRPNQEIFDVWLKQQWNESEILAFMIHVAVEMVGWQLEQKKEGDNVRIPWIRLRRQHVLIGPRGGRIAECCKPWALKANWVWVLAPQLTSWLILGEWLKVPCDSVSLSIKLDINGTSLIWLPWEFSVNMWSTHISSIK